MLNWRAFFQEILEPSNLVPVDRVAQGIVAALSRPWPLVRGCIWQRTTTLLPETRDICAEEIGVNVRLANLMHRNLTLPVMTKLLQLCNPDKLSTLSISPEPSLAVTGVGQPIHEAGNDHFVFRTQ